MIELDVLIHAPPAAVWESLTTPDRMTQWMAEPEMRLEIATSWKVGSPIVMKGFHHARFENRGTVLAFEPGAALRYTHLSSLSRLPDEPRSYTLIDFKLNEVADGTRVTLALSGFPTESIEKHLHFYWRGTLRILKRFVEQGGVASPQARA